MRKATTNRLLPNIQLFAESGEDTKPQEAEQAEPGQPEEAGGAEQPPKPFDDWMKENASYQAEFDKRVEAKLQKALADWTTAQGQAQDEAKKLEKMSATEREAYRLQKEKAQLQTEKADFARQQLQVSVGQELLARGLNPAFASYLTGTDADDSKQRIDAFEQSFRSAVAEGLNQKMRGNPPKDTAKEPGKEDPFLQGFGK